MDLHIALAHLHRIDEQADQSLLLDREQRRRTINVTIALPNGCNLKSKTEKERLICNKYLPRWGLVKEV